MHNIVYQIMEGCYETIWVGFSVWCGKGFEFHQRSQYIKKRPSVQGPQYKEVTERDETIYGVLRNLLPKPT
jgi:hypothetical protein